jgi:cytosine/adenosine deaminase-related metal-dependent hydrolase
MRALHADALVAGDADPIVDGAVVVDAAGVIADVGPAAEVLPRHHGLVVERIRGVVLPGLVNAHTHLELSALRGQIPGGAGFVPWLDHLVTTRAEEQPQDDADAIDRAIDELDAFGIAAVGEVTNSLKAVRALAKRSFAGWVFHEVFGLDRTALEQRVAELPNVVRDVLGDWPSKTELRYAPSPHTLYTTHASVVKRLLAEARDRGHRITVHLAEHPAERRFLQTGDGPIGDWYVKRLRLSRDSFEWPRAAPVEVADGLGMLAPDVLCVHLTDARPEELDLLARRGASVVFCPRSNLHIESRLPPLLAARAAGLCPALGTDSLASNSSLDVLSEARALSLRFPGVSAKELLRMATWEGARALGRPDLGRLSIGARPGLVLVESVLANGTDPCAHVLAHVSAPRRWIVRRNSGLQ